MHIVFAGGGTGGHLFPGLAVAQEIRAACAAARITFCGPGREWEVAPVRAAGYQYCRVAAAPLRASPLGLFRAICSNGLGYRRARGMLRADPPDIVVGLGGYSSVPLGLAAAQSGIPLLLIEPNFVPGRANALLARWASTVCLAFPEAAEQFPVAAHCVTTGNPVRRAIIERAEARGTTQDKTARRLLLVLGGSQGAQTLNHAFLEALPKTAASLVGWQIVHQTGSADRDWVREAYAEADMRATVEPFLYDMAELYSRANLAVTRGGATTLAELAVAGVPAVVLPYPRATAKHQWRNAQAFDRAGAAVVVEDRPEPGRTAANLAASLLPMVKLPALRREMSRAMRALGRPDASAAVAHEVLDTVMSTGCMALTA